MKRRRVSHTIIINTSFILFFAGERGIRLPRKQTLLSFLTNHEAMMVWLASQSLEAAGLVGAINEVIGTPFRSQDTNNTFDNLR